MRQPDQVDSYCLDLVREISPHSAVVSYMLNAPNLTLVQRLEF